MAKYQAISKETHQNKRWAPNDNFGFAKDDALCPLLAQEAPKAALSLPIAFSKTGDHFHLFAVQSLEPNTNYLVDSGGSWLGGYVPAAYRSYPFALLTTDDEQQVLCIDVESKPPTNSEWFDFFDGEGEPSSKVKEILDFLTKVSANRNVTNKLCLLLDEEEMLEPWPITIQKGDDQVPVEGLFRVDEEKLNLIEPVKLGKLRDEGALPLIFCQLLSMQNLARIGKIGEIKNSAATLPKELEFELSNDGGNISFDSV